MRQSIMDDDKSIILTNEKKLFMMNKNIKKLCCMPILMAL